MGIPIQKFHHEVSPGQQEISLRYSDSVTIADSIQTFKIIVKEIAMLSQCFCYFLCQKPFEEFEGNECICTYHFLKDDKKCCFQNS